MQMANKQMAMLGLEPGEPFTTLHLNLGGMERKVRDVVLRVQQTQMGGFSTSSTVEYSSRSCHRYSMYCTARPVIQAKYCSTNTGTAPVSPESVDA